MLKKFTSLTEQTDEHGYSWKHCGATLERGSMGNQEFKQFKWSQAQRTKYDRGGGDKHHPLEKHPDIRQHLKDGWRLSERGNAVSSSKSDVSNAFEQHAAQYHDLYKKSPKVIGSHTLAPSVYDHDKDHFDQHERKKGVVVASTKAVATAPYKSSKPSSWNTAKSARFNLGKTSGRLR